MWWLAFTIMYMGAPPQKFEPMPFKSKAQCERVQKQAIAEWDKVLPESAWISTYCSQKHPSEPLSYKDFPELRNCWRTQTCGGPTGDAEVTIKQKIIVVPRH